MNHTLDAIDDPPLQPAGHEWRATGVVFLIVSLLALSAGVFPGFFLPAHRSQIGTGSSALQMLISTQAIFLVMFYPLLAGRRRASRTGAFLLQSAFECVLFLTAGIPLYVVAAYLSDATAADVIRSLLYLSAVATGALGLGLWVRAGFAEASPRRAGRVWIITAVTLAGALIAVGGPVLYYLLAELTDASVSAGWLWWASPTTCAFESAGAGGTNWYPTPIWAWALWPVVGAVLFFASYLSACLPEVGKNPE